MPFYRFVIFCMFTLGYCVANAQTPQQFAKRGYEAIEEGDAYGAAFYFRKALALDTGNLAYYWMLGESYRNYNNYADAEPAYRWVFAHDDDDEYPTALFWLATMLKHNGNYAEAGEKFEQFPRIYGAYVEPYFKQKAKREAESCSWALAHDTLLNDTPLVHLLPPVNSFDGEFGPQFLTSNTITYSTLLYDTTAGRRLNEPAAALPYTLIANGHNQDWVIQDTLNGLTKANTKHGNFTIAPDSSFGLFTRCASNCRIYAVSWNGESWDDPEDVGGTVNIDGYDATHPHLTVLNNTTYLLFSSNRTRGSAGGYDLWYTEYRGKGRWARARNISQLNSPGNEITPAVDTAQGLIYFSSDWHNGFGGYDIFKAPYELHFSGFGSPENLRKPLNSKANDLYFVLNPANDTALFVSNRSGSLAAKGETCCNDIYLAAVQLPNQLPPEILEELPAITSIPDQDSIPSQIEQLFALPEFLPIALYFDNDQPNPSSMRTTSSQSYDELVVAYVNEFSTYSQRSATPQEVTSFFEREVADGQARLTEVCDSLHSFINRGYHLELGIRGFTSPLASSNYNQQLSKRRIHSVVQFIQNYEDGTLKMALDTGSLIIHELPLGEFLNDGSISDSRTEVEQSVYGLGAAIRRKVEVAFVNYRAPSDSVSNVVIENPYLMWPANRNDSSQKLTLYNPGSTKLQIARVEAPENIRVNLTDEINPGAEVSWEVELTDEMDQTQLDIIQVFIEGQHKPTSIYIKVNPKK